MQTSLNIIAVLCFAIALVLYGVRIVRAFKRDGMKGGLLAKGNWHLWVIGTIFLAVGVLCHHLADQYAPVDPELAAEQKALADALNGPQPAQGSVANTGAAVSALGQDDDQSLPPDDPKAIWALQHAGAVASDGGAIDYDTFPYPTESGQKSPDGYPVYLIECNVQADQCVGATGQPIGSIAQVAKRLTYIRNRDAMSYTCAERICVDPKGHYVGAVPEAMQVYWNTHHAPARGFRG